MTLQEIAVTAEAFDRDRELLNVQNGTLDLRTFERRPHQRADLIAKLAPVAYDPEARSPVWLVCLERWFDGNDRLISFVQRTVGYSLTGLTTEQVLFVLWGTGANGKSTLLERLRRLLGDYSANTGTDVLMAATRERGPENDVARLGGSRFVSASESGEGRRLDEERIKRLTGGDTLTARFLFREHFEFVPEFKLWLAVNAKPEIRGTDHAIWRRVQLIPFTVTIPPNDRDPELGAKLDAEAEGILRWAVDGCRAWRQRGLDPPAEVTDATAEYRAEQDLVGRFVSDECVVHDRASCPAGMLFDRFTSWCNQNGEESLSNQAFGRRLGADGRFRPGRTGRARHWEGLGLRADEPDRRSDR